MIISIFGFQISVKLLIFAYRTSVILVGRYLRNVMYFQVMYLVFLCLYSYVILVDFGARAIMLTEWIVIGWIFTFLCEDIGEVSLTLLVFVIVTFEFSLQSNSLVLLL